MSRTARPEPVPDELSRPYWEQVRAGVFAIQRCSHCGTYAHPPVATCAGCGSANVGHHSGERSNFASVSGRGRLVSWTIVRRALVQGFEERVPFVYALVELAEQPALLVAAELRCDPSAVLAIGEPVQVVIDDGLPMFVRARQT